MLLNCGVGEDSWESLGLQGDPTSPSQRLVLSVHWKDWCWSWNSNTLATWWEELTHLKRPRCWESLRAGGEGLTVDEMFGWHHWLNGHGIEWTLGVGDGQGGPACCKFWGCKELDTTEWLNWTEHHSRREMTSDWSGFREDGNSEYKPINILRTQFSSFGMKGNWELWKMKSWIWKLAKV